MEKIENTNQPNAVNPASEFGQTKEISTGSGRSTAFLIGIIFLFLAFVLALVYFLFFRTTREFDTLETAVNLRGSAVDLALGEEHKLDDFTSLFYAPNSIKFNTCSGETEVFNNEWSWTKDWIYLILFDSLYAELTGDDSYMDDSRILMDSLYEQYASPVGENGEVMIENQDMVGFESICLPYFVLNSLDSVGEGNYEGTLALAKQLCEDFYDISSLEMFECEDGNPGCFQDEKFYSDAEGVFVVDEDELLDGQEPFFYPPFIIIDDYIVAYENNLDEFVKYINFGLYKNIEYKKQTLELLRRYPDIDSCVENKDLYFGLLKAMSIKKGFMNDEQILSRHDKLNEDVFELCATHYPDYEAVVSEQITLGDGVEAYYLFKNDDLNVDIEKMVSHALNEKVLTRNYMGQEFQFLKDAMPEDQSGFGICTDVEINYSHNLKTSLYLLIYSIYGD
jgi:hypothetical protein